MNKSADFYIEHLKLEKHPEGGYFSEVYRSDEIIKNEALPERYTGNRVFSTSIYFLLKNDQVSSFHRIKSDEIWHLYEGGSLTIYVIDENGNLNKNILGRDIEKGETFQFTLPKNCWFGAELNDKTGFALIGCTVSPGFDFKDFELGQRDFLLNTYPQYSDIIEKLTN